MKLRDALLLILDQVDYTATPPACRSNDMVGAVLSTEVLKIAKEALAKDEAEKRSQP